jgi:tetratricopeptide (TPR) repeat protein
MSRNRRTAQLEIRLLGGCEAYVDGQPITLSKRAWKLVILLLLRPHATAQEIRDLFESGIATKAKSELRKALGKASYWLDDDPHAFRLSARPLIDYDQIPPDAEAAFDYCLARGDLLPGFSGMDVVVAERDSYHQRLQEIVAELLRQCSSSDHQELLTTAAQVLPSPYLDVLRQRHLRLEITPRESIETTLRLLESHVHTDAVERTDVDRLKEVVSQLERTAQTWHPNATEHIDRAAMLVRFFAPTALGDWDDVYVKLANSYYLAGDLYRAVEMLRPWLSTPGASYNAFCTAALYDLELGYISDAEACFDRAHASPAPDFKLTVREKRDVQLRSLRDDASPRTLIYKAEAMAKESAYNDMSPGSRASVWCNAARAADSPATALDLTQKGRAIDKDVENPNYEFSLLRYARAVGDKDLACKYDAQVDELMHAPRPPGFHLSLMGLRADDLTRRFSESLAHDSPQHRARLEEADALLGSVYGGYRAACNVPQMCRILLRRARIAQQLGEVSEAYEHATSAHVLGGRQASDRLRYAREAEQLQRQLAPSLDDADYRRRTVSAENAVDHIFRLPDALRVPEDAAA